MENFKIGDHISISECGGFKDSFIRRLIGKIFPFFDRSSNLNGEYIITGEYTAKKDTLPTDNNCST